MDDLPVKIEEMVNMPLGELRAYVMGLTHPHTDETSSKSYLKSLGQEYNRGQLIRFYMEFRLGIE